MIILNYIIRNIPSIEENEPIIKVRKIFEQNEFDLIPVLRESKLIGIITDGGIRRYLLKIFIPKTSIEAILPEIIVTAGDLMTRKVISIPYDYTIDEAGELLNREKITGAPVINNKNEFIGIITKTCIIRSLSNKTGAEKRGIQYLFIIENKLSSIYDLEDMVKSYGGTISSSITLFNQFDPVKNKLYLRIYGIDRFKLRSLNEKLSGIAELKYVVDHPEIVKGL